MACGKVCGDIVAFAFIGFFDGILCGKLYCGGNCCVYRVF